MSAEVQLLDNIIVQVQQLSVEHRLHLIQRITETLLTPKSVSPQSQPLQYGKYRNGQMSTWADFSAAEWKPSKSELNSQ